MTRGHHHPHEHGSPGHAHEGDLAEVLELDAEVLGSGLDDITAWVAGQAPTEPQAVVDVGTGTGTGALALARRFPTAEVVALDRSATLLSRAAEAAGRHGVADRVRLLQADLDDGWPELTTVDLAWAASSLHEVRDPERLLRDIRTALRPGGLLAVVELDALAASCPTRWATGGQAWRNAATRRWLDWAGTRTLTGRRTSSEPAST